MPCRIVNMLFDNEALRRVPPDPSWYTEAGFYGFLKAGINPAKTGPVLTAAQRFASPQARYVFRYAVTSVNDEATFPYLRSDRAKRYERFTKASCEARFHPEWQSWWIRALPDNFVPPNLYAKFTPLRQTTWGAVYGNIIPPFLPCMTCCREHPAIHFDRDRITKAAQLSVSKRTEVCPECIRCHWLAHSTIYALRVHPPRVLCPGASFVGFPMHSFALASLAIFGPSMGISPRRIHGLPLTSGFTTLWKSLSTHGFFL